MKTPTPALTLLIADDHQLIREGLPLILEKEKDITVLGVAANGAELVELVKTHQPRVVLTDIVMPGMNGIEATRQIRSCSPGTEVIAISMFDDEALVIDMLDAGAIGYLLKNADKTEIIRAIRAAGQHKHYYCRTISLQLARFVSASKTRKKPTVAFTEKELEVIRYICREFTTEQIGKQMFLSKRTIDGYRSSILSKINARGTAGIVIYAIQHNLYSLNKDQGIKPGI